MSQAVLQILHPGLGASLQDIGRMGWRRWGVPLSGVMDAHAAAWANRLVGNPPEAPVLEFLLQGAQLAALRPAWIAVTGADAAATVNTWHSVHLSPGQTISFPQNRSGTWTYLALAGGIAGEKILGSASAYPRGRLGRSLAVGDLICSVADHTTFRLPDGVASQATPAFERREYARPPRLRVWPGPQMERFAAAERDRFFAQPWQVSSQSDRVGYRLDGAPLKSSVPQLISEPVRLGTIQVPENGQPIVTMRDGPTVGGYPKLGVVDPADLSWLAQCRTGQTVQFQAVDLPAGQVVR
jgi:biotin-dependent carboxylase-like uncharacterized protein